MFGLIADSLTTATSVLFPVFASFKAIRASDPAQLTPWLMYWTTLSLFLAGENFFYPILSWTPFYSWIRLGVHLYLVLPGQQGSVYLYRRYLHPWLTTHEREIDEFITKSHDKAKTAGLQYVQSAVEFVKTKLLGLPPAQPSSPPASRAASYSQTMLSRFAMPTARPGVFPGTAAPDLLGMLGTALQHATSGTRQAGAELIPAQLKGAERIDYIATQQERLRTLLRAFDTAAAQESSTGAAAAAAASDALKKSKSETDFEDLSNESFPEGSNKEPAKARSSWGGWIWGTPTAPVAPGKKEQ